MLDSVVARTVHAAHLLELACHDQGEWGIAVGGAVSPATRSLAINSIVIEANFAPQCWVITPFLTAELQLNGETVAVRPVAVPDEEVGFSVSWRFSVVVPEVASIH